MEMKFEYLERNEYDEDHDYYTTYDLDSVVAIDNTQGIHHSATLE